MNSNKRGVLQYCLHANHHQELAYEGY